MSHQIVPTTWNPEICSDCGFPASQHAVLYGEPEHTNLPPLTDDDLLRIADRPGGVNDQLRAAMDARDHENGRSER